MAKSEIVKEVLFENKSKIMSTKIEWTNETWNWLSGCTKVSPGCKNCYAEKMSRRLAAMGQDKYKQVIDSDGRFNGKTVVTASEYMKPNKWKASRMIFVNSMSDTFHESVTITDLYNMFDQIQANPQHIFLILTKRPDIMFDAYNRKSLKNYFGMPNVWLGVTVENQEMAQKRIPILLKVPAAKRFVSIEPMLGPVDLLKYYFTLANGTYAFKGVPVSDRTKWIDLLDWVICGSESGPARRPFNEDWARSLRDQCIRASVPFFFKQRYIGNQKFSMPLLDGKIWDQIPER